MKDFGHNVLEKIKCSESMTNYFISSRILMKLKVNINVDFQNQLYFKFVGEFIDQMLFHISKHHSSLTLIIIQKN